MAIPVEPQGQHLINGRWVGAGGALFQAVNPATGAVLAPAWPMAGAAELPAAFAAAEEALRATRDLPGSRWADLLEAIAAELQASAEPLIARAAAETALPAQPRLQGELGRTTGQLRLFAGLVREGSWVDAVIDPALPERQPLPRADLRRMLRPLGPVVVFGASNFPLAFGAAGGDVASALAAGNPVLVKGHSNHPGTNELVARAVHRALTSCGLPAGLYALLQGSGRELGTAMVRHPAAAAVGFTGSQSAGRALADLAAARPRPIPVFAEMGSLNPLVILPGALQARAAAIATGLAGSVTMGAGQFCTKPGVVFVLESPATEGFLAQLSAKLQETPAYTLLADSLRDAFCGALAGYAAVPGVRVRVASQASGHAGIRAALYETDAATFQSQPALRHEAFGPATLVVRCASLASLLACLPVLDGNLTGSLHHGPEDSPETVRAVSDGLAPWVGRLIFNGFPTGVEVCHAMVHGGPYPATTDSRGTSVGTLAIARFARPQCWQDAPAWLLPPALRNDNPLGLWRVVNGVRTRDPLA